MADKQTHELPIGELPVVDTLEPETLIPVEQRGAAMHMTGKQFAAFAREAAAADVQRAVIAANAAETAKTSAQQAATAADGHSASAGNAASEAAQSARSAAAARQAVENMDVEAETLPPGSEATVAKRVAEDGTVTLRYGIPKGEKGDQGATGPTGAQGTKGDKGDKGDRGDSGVMMPVAGFYSFYVDEDGDLWAVYPSGDATPAFEYDGETGDLYCVIGG